MSWLVLTVSLLSSTTPSAVPVDLVPDLALGEVPAPAMPGARTNETTFGEVAAGVVGVVAGDLLTLGGAVGTIAALEAAGFGGSHTDQTGLLGGLLALVLLEATLPPLGALLGTKWAAGDTEGQAYAWSMAALVNLASFAALLIPTVGVPLAILGHFVAVPLVAGKLQF